MNPLLRDQLAAIIAEAPRVMEFTHTGEVLSSEAMSIARAYDAASVAQQRALDAVVESWGNLGTELS